MWIDQAPTLIVLSHFNIFVYMKSIVHLYTPRVHLHYTQDDRSLTKLKKVTVLPVIPRYFLCVKSAQRLVLLYLLFIQ